MTSEPSHRMLFLGAGSQMQCGVGHFTHLLRETIERSDSNSSITLTLTRSDGSLADIWRAVGSAHSVICNFPIVAWKCVILRPLLVLTLAKLRQRRIVLVQHEWAGLNWMRRVTYMPALALADTIVMFSPLVKQELTNDRWVGWTARKCVLAPLPPNIAAPAGITDSKLRQRLAAARQDGRLVIGHFGSIYPGKQPNVLLDIGASLRAKGHHPLLVYIGSFIRGTDTVEQDFHTHATALGLADDVIVSGYIASDHEVFGLFSEIDAFCYAFDEGVSARRASILAAVQSGRPVIVTGPALLDELEHHPRFKDLIVNGAVVLVPRGSTPDDYADRILAAVRRPVIQTAFDVEVWWDDVAKVVMAQINPANETEPDSAARRPRPEM